MTQSVPKLKKSSVPHYQRFKPRFWAALNKSLVAILLMVCGMLCNGGKLIAQIPVMRFAIFDGEISVSPQDNNYEVWLVYVNNSSEKEVAEDFNHDNLLSTYNSDSVLLPWAYAHKIPGNSYPYDLYICHGFDTMTVHIRTWFVDWYQANFLIVYQPGEFCFDMLDARAARNGIAPVDIRPFLTVKEGDCKSR
jgi:hypothetical protein